jgi:PIN domain nuclease of toxin-antitoxin system
MDEGGFAPLPITIRHGITAGELPRHHDDPFDRMLIAQAVAEGGCSCPLVTVTVRWSPWRVAHV